MRAKEKDAVKLTEWKIGEVIMKEWKSVCGGIKQYAIFVIVVLRSTRSTKLPGRKHFNEFDPFLTFRCFALSFAYSNVY